MRKLLFIYNPTSGKGKVRSALAEVLDTFTKYGWLVTVYPTQCPGDATRAANELGGGFDRVVCAGGDGTLSETVAGLMELAHPPVLAFLPSGSTNDCGVNLRLPIISERSAALTAGEGFPRPWDIGRLNSRPFVYVAAFGAFTEVAYDTPQDLKNTFGHLAYIMSGIASIPSITPYHIKVEYDGQCVEGDFYYGMVCNSYSVGGIKGLPTDRVALDDGLFEVVLVKKPIAINEIIGALQSLIRQAPVEGSAVLSFHASKMKFTSSAPIPWTLDGEFGGKYMVTYAENYKQALTIVQGPETPRSQNK